MSGLRALWWRLRASLWVLPGLLVVAATLLAFGMIELGSVHNLELERRWPRLFGAGAQGSRSLLSAIATTMLTVAATVFSITLAVLSLAASQYSPRVIRTFMDDRPTQLVLGVFVGVFVYCLVVLRTIRDGEDPVVPSLAVLGGIVLAFVAVGFLVFFIHHLASSIEAPSILQRVGRGTDAAVEDLFPERLGDEVDEAAEAQRAPARAWAPVPALKNGYIVSVDNDALLAFAREQGRIVRMALAIGDYALEGQPLAWLEGEREADEPAGRALNACYSLDRQRTIEQDAAYGLQQMVDIALRALSPGINDQSTALLCIDRMTEVLVRLARRRVENRYRRDATGLRVIAVGPTFAGLLALAFADLREAGAAKPAVLERLLWSLERIGAATANSCRRKVLAEEAARIGEAAARALPAPAARERTRALAARLEQSLR